MNSPTMKHVISSPRVLSRFSPVASMIRRNSFSSKRSGKLPEDSKLSPGITNVKKSTFTKSSSIVANTFTDATEPKEASSFYPKSIAVH